MDYNGDQGNRSFHWVTIRIMTDNQKEEKRTLGSTARECADPADMARGVAHGARREAHQGRVMARKKGA